MEQVHESLQYLKEIVSSFPVKNSIETISKLKNRDTMKKEITKQIEIIKDFVNRDAKIFIQQHQI